VGSWVLAKKNRHPRKLRHGEEEFRRCQSEQIIFPDRLYSEEWRVEWFDDDGGCDVAIFAGPNAQIR
jgi:hypothetical protein